MAEDAAMGKNILIVDDINDTGATFNWLVDDWEKSGPPGDWSNVWNNNIKFAVLTDNLGSEFTKEIDFHADEVNKNEQPVWLVYPWEEWWKK